MKYCCYNKKTTFLIALFGVLLGISGLRQSASTQSDSSYEVMTVPNLLYHSIPSHDSADSRYVVSVDEFKNQMKQLEYWGYSTITIKQLVDYIKKGSTLPPRPIVNSFDDGYLDKYKNSFPTMVNYGFAGTVYIVANRLIADGFLQAEELQELLDHGWEVGSHGMTHTDLLPWTNHYVPAPRRQYIPQ